MHVFIHVQGMKVPIISLVKTMTMLKTGMHENFVKLLSCLNPTRMNVNMN